MLRAIHIGLGLAIAGTALAGPARAAECTHVIDSDGFPVWSADCDTTLKPGVLGPLRMGKTTVKQAKQLGYLVRNDLCDRVDGIGTGGDWTSRKGKIVAWQARFPTSKGLKVGQRLARALALYPTASRTGFVKNPYTSGGWNIYSTKGAKGWLDIYVDSESTKIELFYARAKRLPGPVMSWAFDGC